MIFAGRVPHGEVRRYYDLVDVLVYPRFAMRLTETVTPLKPLEAMAQGRVVLASDVGGHRELIALGETGFLFRHDDVDDLARCAARALGNRAALTSVVANGRRFVERERNWRVSVECYRNVYERALGREVSTRPAAQASDALR